MAQRWVEALLGVLAVASLGGCGADAADEPERGPVITPAHDWNAYPMAEMTGRLVERRGCLLLDDQVVLWPHGTTWDADARAVVLIDGSRAVVGRRLRSSGGVYDVDTDFTDLLGSTGAAGRLSRCVSRTNAAGVVLVGP